MKLHSPCYNKETKTDCQERCVGCSTICTLWHEYEARRQKEYEKRAQLSQEASAEITAQDRKIRRVMRYKNIPRRNKR